MPKPHTFPITFDSVLKLSISDLKKWNYLISRRQQSGTLTWSRNGNETASIGISSDTAVAPPYIELDYTYKDKPRKYRIRLVSEPSNLGLGEVWYFLCPQTGKRCRILYCVEGWFLHRDVFRGCMYESQTRSKKMREFEKHLGIYFRQDSLYDELHKKYFKPFYAGKPTKRHIKISKKLHQASLISHEQIDKLIAGLL